MMHMNIVSKNPYKQISRRMKEDKCLIFNEDKGVQYLLEIFLKVFMLHNISNYM